MQWNYRMSYDWRRLLKSEILRVLVPFFLTVLWTKLPAFFVNHHQEKSAKISRTKGLFIFFICHLLFFIPKTRPHVKTIAGLHCPPFPQIQIQNDQRLLRSQISQAYCGRKTFDTFSEWKSCFEIPRKSVQTVGSITSPCLEKGARVSPPPPSSPLRTLFSRRNVDRTRESGRNRRTGP